MRFLFGTIPSCIIYIPLINCQKFGINSKTTLSQCFSSFYFHSHVYHFQPHSCIAALTLCSLFSHPRSPCCDASTIAPVSLPRSPLLSNPLFPPTPLPLHSRIASSLIASSSSCFFLIASSLSLSAFSLSAFSLASLSLSF